MRLVAFSSVLIASFYCIWVLENICKFTDLIEQLAI